MVIGLAVLTLIMAGAAFAQLPVIETGVSQELAKWRAARYSDVRYKLNLTLEKMSPVLKGTIEIRVKVSEPGAIATGFLAANDSTPIILDWRKIRGSESLSTISNVTLNGEVKNPVAIAPGSDSEHLIFRDGVVAGENVIKLDFTSPILTSGSAITRYVDKEDGAEYIYSLFVPSDASTAFPVFDQPDLKARFQLTLACNTEWRVVSNTEGSWKLFFNDTGVEHNTFDIKGGEVRFPETQPISTYVFAFAAGPWAQVSEPGAVATGVLEDKNASKPDAQKSPLATASGSDTRGSVFVRKSQLEKFKPHAAEVFRLNREGIKYLETYFDYKFPFPKYDIVLIPEFPFGGMEHAGATFLREDRVIFPQEPTKNDYITRANVIFHEAAHQWFGDTVTMKWFDDLWLKEGFAEFMAYKTLEKVMPEYNAWKVFYERNKQAAYLTDSTKGTTPIYQEIANLNSAKSAYGNIVYRKAPSFLKQAEFYLGPDKFQTAVRAFLKKHEYANAGWEDLVREFETASRQDVKDFAKDWVKQRGMPKIVYGGMPNAQGISQGILFVQKDTLENGDFWTQKFNLFLKYKNGTTKVQNQVVEFGDGKLEFAKLGNESKPIFIFPNYQDYGYGIFLLDDKSRDYVLKNIQNEKDDFLRTMMWGSLWDSVREGELDPTEYVELVIKGLAFTIAEDRFVGDSAPQPRVSGTSPARRIPIQTGETDESTVATLLGRVSTAMNYYMPDAERVSSPHVSKGSSGSTDILDPCSEAGRSRGDKQTNASKRKSADNAEPLLTCGLQTRLEAVLIDRMQNAPTLGQRITFYRAFLNVASTENARRTLREILNSKFEISNFKLKTKDRFDIVTRLLILNDPEAPKLLADLEKTETSDEAKRYAYAARAGIASAENKAKFWADYTANKDLSESWIEASLGAFNSTRHAGLTLPYLERALKELSNHKRTRKIFFINNWLSAFIGGQRSEEALAIVNKFLADNPNLDRDLRLKILENVDLIERAVKIRGKYGKS